MEAGEIQHWQLTGPDEFFGLVMPPAHIAASPELFTRLVRHPRPEKANLRSALQAIPSSERPELRWYTVRHFDAQRGLLEFDVATHGVTRKTLDLCEPGTVGPGLRWALHASPGDLVGIFTARALWHRRWDRQLLVADASSLPSVFAIADFLRALHPDALQSIRMVATVENDRDVEHEALEQLRAHAGHVDVLHAPIPRQALTVIEHLQQHDDQIPDYVWVAGEGELCKSVRGLAVKDWGLESEAVYWCPYWYKGRPRP